MSTKSLAVKNEFLPSVVNSFLNPWNNWFGKGFVKTLSVPAVNISENKDGYTITVAAPGLKKEDFDVRTKGSLLYISAEKEDKKDEKEGNYRSREYNFSSFSRTFNLPVGVNAEKIEASYEDGVLKLALPKKEEAKKTTAKNIAVK
ncbi:MAG: Hsp20/alpha crystallin family protein [Bacteroidetes bacterium]|nr:Hsp20/alpha crystallin family protein [Bacteroidota bacterium]